MNSILSALSQPRLIPSFDGVVERFADADTSFTEEEALQKSHWEKGEDARLREDFRFRPTPWNRWMLSHNLLANDALSRWLRDNHKSAVLLDEALDALGDSGDRRWVFCIGDPRLRLEDGLLRLASGELTNEPLTEDPLDIEKYVTHLPIHTLKAVAASEASGEWGPEAQEELIETLGWLRVTIPHKLNNRMFVARIEGNSMDDGRRGMLNGAYAVFELWPAGTRQNKIVLVRGAFKDPETGSYALKKYVADMRDKEGRHQRISLVSLNSDKERYPDIELDPEDEAAVFVVAQFIAVLSQNQYARKPKRVQDKPGRRNLSESHVSGRMRKRVKEIFGEKGEDKEPGKALEQKASRLVCMDLEGGGLHVETVPLTWMPNFVKRITLKAGSSSITMLAANLKHRTWRQMVPPSKDGYAWSAPGFEEEIGEELDRLVLLGLSENEAVIFKVDVAGIGQPMEGRKLSPGQEYRVVLSPSLKIEAAPIGSIGHLDADWQLWEFVLPVDLARGVQELLAKFHLEIGKTTPQLSWVTVPPVSFRQTPKGETYPCFHVKQPPILSIKGISLSKLGDASIFVLSGDEITSKPFPEGEQWIIQLEDIPVGPALVQVLHQKTDILPASLPFFIVEEAAECIKAEIEIRIGPDKNVSDEKGHIVLKQDLGKLEQEDNEIGIAGPPLWPVRYDWQADSKSLITSTHIGESGAMDMDELLNRTQSRRESFLPGNWCFDFADLGVATLRHHPIPSPQDLMKRFKAFIEEKGGSVMGLKGQFPLLRNVWLEPLFPLMGLESKELPLEDLRMAPNGMTAMLFFRTVRQPNGEIKKEKHSIFVLVSTKDDITRPGEGTAWEYADALCNNHQLAISIISDGICWMRHRAHSSMKGNIYHLLDIVKRGAGEDLEAFLSACGGW